MRRWRAYRGWIGFRAGRGRSVPRGDAGRGLALMGRQYAALMRLITLPPTMVVALWIAADAPRPLVTWVDLLTVAGWSCVYATVMLRRKPGRWLTLVDTAALAGLGLSSPWSVPESWLGDARSWLIPFVCFACVGYQYYASRPLGAVATLLVLTGTVVGTWSALPEGGKTDSVVTAIWSGLVAALARVMWTLLENRGARADDEAEAAEAERRQWWCKDTVRAAESAQNEELHDGAVNTLDMVGLGLANEHRVLTADLAARDLARIRTWGEAQPAITNVVAGLRAAIRYSPLRVELSAPESLEIDARVARAVIQAAEEVLRNVFKHAEIDSCRVRVEGDADHVRIEVTDDGRGFDPAGISPERYGIRRSIHKRMEAVGGYARVESEPGKGTRIELEWKA